MGLYMVNDACDKRILPTNYMKIFFHSKGIEMINLPRILHDRRATACIPTFFKCMEPPTVGYSCTKTISSKVFNFRQSVKDLDFEVGTNDMSCACSSSPFISPPLGHIVTGDLNIITDKKLRQLLMKGPNYREQNNINWDVCIKICKKAVKECKVKWAKSERVDVRVLIDWEQTVFSLIDKRVGLLRKKYIHTRKKQVLKNIKCLNFLKHFQRNFVLVPADKAASNVIVVCKKFYLETVVKELCSPDPSSPQTYAECVLESTAIVTNHMNYMKGKHIDVPADMQQLPSFYWLPKMHKSPYGCRFIAASNKCTTKPLSSMFTSCFSTILTHYKEYCGGIYRHTGMNAFWIINNSQQVLEMLERVNTFGKAQYFDGFDFATLYTNIPHDSLKNNFQELIAEAYRVREAKYLCFNKLGVAYWYAVDTTKGGVSEGELLEWLEFLIDNVYIQVGNKVFRQRIGIPMGTVCAPLLANLFLFYYEYKYMRHLISSNLRLAKKFSNTVRLLITC